MYILADAPSGGSPREAFDVLDNAFGVSEFTEGQAVAAISNQFECSTEEASGTFSRLVSSGYVSEVD